MEQEIIKHTENIGKSMKKKDTPLLKKLGEIAIEICIIVFAITLSMWFHDSSEQKHERKEAKEFLLGLRLDLISTIEDAKGAQDDYEEKTKVFTYLSSLDTSIETNSDSLEKYFAEFSTTPIFHINSSRFNGFMSSGKIDQIPNKTLLTNILDFYQHDTQTYNGMMRFWEDSRGELAKIVSNSLVTTDNGLDNKLTILTNPKVSRIAKKAIPGRQFIDQHSVMIKSATEIVRNIESDYKLDPSNLHF